MKNHLKLFAYITALGFIICSCSEVWQINQNSKTLSGSVSSKDAYTSSVELNGAVLDYPSILLVQQLTDGSISLTLQALKTSPGTDFLFGDVSGVMISGIPLEGERADVRFNTDCQVLFNGRDGTAGSVRGWLKNLTILDLMTKVTPAKWKLEGEIVISWTDASTGESNILRIFDIVS